MMGVLKHYFESSYVCIIDLSLRLLCLFKKNFTKFCFAFSLGLGRGNRDEKRNEGEEKGGGNKGEIMFCFFLLSNNFLLISFKM